MHVFALRSTGPDYILHATPLGPPDHDGEREPNSEATLAERYRVGSRRVGRLPDPTDHDFMRMTIAAPSASGCRSHRRRMPRSRLRLSLGGLTILEVAGLPPGEPIEQISR